MSFAHWLLLIIAACSGSLLVSSVEAGPGKPATPAARRDLIFSHKQHVEDNSQECGSCHAAEGSRAGLDDLLPGHATCRECHEVDAASGCGTCHIKPKPEPQARITHYSPLFDHERHLAAGYACAACHHDLDTVLDPDERGGRYPTMAECMQCHDTRTAKNECTTCHEQGFDLKPSDHLADWISRHGAVAGEKTQEFCNQCHGRAGVFDCQQCHQGDAVLSPHARNYISRHGQDAHLSDVSCAVCHEDRADCNACHRAMNVLPTGHFRPGWVGGADGGRHGEEAKSDLESCIACHDQPDREPVCARCHGK